MKTTKNKYLRRFFGVLLCLVMALQQPIYYRAETSTDPVVKDGVSFSTVEKKAGAVKEDIYWIDNNNAAGSRPDINDAAFKQSLYQNATLQTRYEYTKEDGTVVMGTISKKLGELGITENQLGLSNLGGTGHYTFDIPANVLPSKVNILEDDGQTIAASNVILEPWSMSFSGTDKLVQNGYVLTEVTDDNVSEYPGAAGNKGLYFVKDMTFTATAEIRCGEDLMHGIYDEVASLYHFYWETHVQTTDGKDELHSGHLPLNSEDLQIYLHGGDYSTIPGTDTFQIDHLQKYNLDGSEIEYYIDRPKEPNDKKIEELIYNGTDLLPGDDYLQESIENDAVSNYGSNKERVYNGGKLILTRTGYTKYEATKKWYDVDDSSERPDVTFELWRVALHEGLDSNDLATLYQKATPVLDIANSKTASVTIPSMDGDQQTISFENVFPAISQATEGGYLPKYDAEGFPYIYLTREQMNGAAAAKYKTYYGTVMEDGSIQDDLLEGVTKRDASDDSLYNGGTLSNVLNGTVAVKGEKSWKAAVFQSELKDVKVTLTLQSRKYTENGTEPWVNTDQTVTFDGFTEESLTQTTSASMPKYNMKGERLEYQWIESAVYQGDSMENLLEEDGGITLNQMGTSVHYHSKSVTRVEDGVYTTSITNELEDKTSYKAEKVWDEGLKKVPISLLMYRFDYQQTRKKLMTEAGTDYSLDGEVDGEKTPLYIDGTLVGYVREYEPWKAEFTELNKYGPKGHPYEYLLLEGTVGNWSVSYQETKDKDGIVTTIITNSIGEGESTELYVRKLWVDDGDVQHREPVTFTIYKRTDANSPWEDAKAVTVTAADNWWTRVTIDGKVAKENLLILETKVGETEISYTDKEKAEIYQIQQGNRAADDQYVEYKGKNHRYVVSYSMVNVENIEFYAASNNRLGSVDVDVTKKWIDGNDTSKREKLVNDIKSADLDKDGTPDGWTLGLKLNCSQSGAIDYENMRQNHFLHFN